MLVFGIFSDVERQSIELQIASFETQTDKQPVFKSSLKISSNALEYYMVMNYTFRQVVSRCHSMLLSDFTVIRSDLFKGIRNAIDDGLNQLGSIFSDVLIALGSIIVLGFRKVIEELANVLSPLLSAIEVAVSSLAPLISDLASLLNDVLSAIMSLASEIYDLFDSILNTIVDVLEDISDLISDLAEFIVFALISFMFDVVDALLDALIWMADVVVEFLLAILEYVLFFLDEFITILALILFFVWDLFGLPDLLRIVELFLNAFFTFVDNLPAMIDDFFGWIWVLFDLLLLLWWFYVLVVSAVSSGDIGEYLEKVVEKSMRNIFPFDIFGFHLHIPQFVVVLPLTVFGIVGTSSIYNIWS